MKKMKCVLLFFLFVSLVFGSNSGPGDSAHPEANEIQQHTTGPNCWVVGSPTLEVTATLPGSSVYAPLMTLPGVLNHIGHPVFVNMTEINFSCIDGRYMKGIVATVGGDAAEFILALNIAYTYYHVYLDDFVIDGLFRSYIAQMEPLRKFYMHTDDHAWHSIMEKLNQTTSFDPRDTPDSLKQALLNLLFVGGNNGCGHLKLMLNNPDKYATENWIVQSFFRAFFNYMWAEDKKRTPSAQKLMYVILTGDHNEQGILEIYDNGCPGMAAAVASASSYGTYFVHHDVATNFLRNLLSKFITAKFSSNFQGIANPVSDFEDKMHVLGEQQLLLTAGKLAGGLSIIKVDINGKRLNLFDSTIGMISATLVALVVAFIVAYFVYLRPVISVEIINMSQIVQQGTNSVIIRLLKVTVPLFIFIGLIFLVGYSYPVMLCIWFAAIISVCSACAVLYASSVAETRASSATLIGMQEAVQISIQSGIVVGVLITAPLLLVLAIICDVSHASQQALFGFGFGGTLVALIVRVGGAIFSKSIQNANSEISSKNSAHSEDSSKEVAARTILLSFISSSVADVMGATGDLSNSMVLSIIAALVIGTSLYGDDGIALPLTLAAAGLIASIVSFSIVAVLLRSCGEDGKEKDGSEFTGHFRSLSSAFSLMADGVLSERKLLRILRLGYLLGTLFFLLLGYMITSILHFDSNMYYCIVIGQMGRLLLAYASEIATYKEDIAPILGVKLKFDLLSLGNASAECTVEQDVTGKDDKASSLSMLKKLISPLSSGLLQALLVGMSSSLMPVIVIFTLLLWCASLSDTFGVVIAGVSLMSNCAYSIAYSVVSPILSNSHKLLDSSNHGDTVLLEAAQLDRLGQTVSNTVRGFTSGAASAVSFCLFIAFTSIAGVSSIDLMLDPQVLPGLLIGAMMPFVFAALTLATLASVSKKTACRIRSLSASMSDCEYLNKVSDDCVSSSLWHLLVPAIFAIGITDFVHYFFQTKVLSGYLAGAIVSGLVMSTTLTTTGAAMDSHDAAATLFSGALKDAGGPSINMLTKLITMVSIILIAKNNFVLFVLNMIVVALVLIIYAFNVYRGRASFDPSEFHKELTNSIGNMIPVSKSNEVTVQECVAQTNKEEISLV